jgi:hypothetical protein
MLYYAGNCLLAMANWMGGRSDTADSQPETRNTQRYYAARIWYDPKNRIAKYYLNNHHNAHG